MSIKLPVIIEYNGKGAKKAQDDLASLAKSYLRNAVTAGAVYEVAKKSIMAANEDAKSQRLLANTLRNTTNATTEQIAAVEKNLQALQYSSAVADDELRPALQQLAMVTGNTTKAQDLLSTALDISAATGRDLQTVSLSLSRAYQGNIGALRRLGLTVSDSAIKSKDFQMAMEEIQPAVAGAAAEAAKGADGGWKKLGLAVGDLSEVLGTELNNALSPAVSALTKVGQTSAQSGIAAQGLQVAIRSLAQNVIGSILPWYKFNAAVQDAQKNTQALNDTTRSTAANFRMVEQAQRGLFDDITAKREQDAIDRKRAAAEAAKRLAEANRQTLASALQAAKDKVAAITQQIASYSDSIRDVISGYASLSDAVSVAKSNEDDYQAALKDRADAYAELAKLQTVVFDAATGKTTVANAEDLAAALEKVADAETAVTTAKGKQRDYTKEFAAQVSAAKQFSTDLQSLIAAGLGAAGIQQLLNLGPVAGDAVAKDLLAGTKGITIGGLNADLASLATAGQTVGGQVAAGVYGADLLSAQAGVNAVTQAQSMNITIQATSADPDKIVAAIVEWSKKNGKLPNTVKVAG